MRGGGRRGPPPEGQYSIATGRLRRRDSTAASAMSWAWRPIDEGRLGRLPALEGGDEGVEETRKALLSVEVGIAFAADAGRAESGHVGDRGRQRLQHSPLSEDLDPLVEPVDRPSPVVDVAERPARHPEEHHRGVDVARLADPRLDATRARGVDLGRPLADEPGDEVEVVDGLVAEEAPGDRDVLGRGRPVVARDEVDDFDRPDFSFPDPPPDLPVLGEGAAPEPDRDGDVGRGRFGDDGPDPGEVEVDRLLAVGGLAGAERLAEQVDVGVGGGRDEDRVERVRGPDRRRVGLRAGAVLLGHPFGGRTVDIADADQLRPGMMSDVPGVDRTGPAGPEEGESNHGRLLSAGVAGERTAGAGRRAFPCGRIARRG